MESNVTESPRNGFLEAVGLVKKFRMGDQILPVLQGIDLSVQKGEMVGIVGASGVGKSTLLHILGTLDRPTSGRVFFDGSDPFEKTERELARFRNRKIGFVFQFHQLLPEFTALENVQLPGLIQGRDPASVRGRALELLDRVELSHRLHHRPGELSGGEQQRVAIARALLNEPDVVLADEPTGNLDTRTGGEVFDLFRSITRQVGHTVVLVTHNPMLMERVDRVVRLKDGKVVTPPLL
jgi:lipoprotein-releasing system ATP-binding protein